MTIKRRLTFKFKDKLYISFIIVVILSFIIFKLVNKESLTILIPYLESDMKKYALEIINNSIIDNNDKDIYNELIYTEKNKNEEIIGVDFDTLKVNTFLSNMNKSVISELNDLESGKYSNFYNSNNGVYNIPFYVFSNNILLKNLGFNMPFKVKILGNANSNLKTELNSYGINNALIKVYIDFRVNMLIVLPYVSKEVSVNTEIPVLMKIINGSIPEVYGGMYSVNSHSV